MNVYTSYYWAYQNGKLPEDIVPIAISRTQPKGLNLTSLEKLKPTWNTLNVWQNSDKDAKAEQVYTQSYGNQLRKLDPKELWTQLEKLSKGRDVVLLCFENNKKFCHRHLVADWFTNAGFPVSEYGMGERSHEVSEQAEQISFDFFNDEAENKQADFRARISEAMLKSKNENSREGRSDGIPDQKYETL